MSEYTCANCGGIFDFGWSKEEAMQEMLDTFGNVPLNKLKIVCDDCYQMMNPKNNPELVEASIKHYKIKRYYIPYQSAYEKESDDGEFCRYEDVENLELEIIKLKQDISEKIQNENDCLNLLKELKKQVEALKERILAILSNESSFFRL